MLRSTGGIFFEEFSYFGAVNVVGFCCGVCLLMFGIFLLSPEMAAPPRIASKPCDDGDGRGKEAMAAPFNPQPASVGGGSSSSSSSSSSSGAPTDASTNATDAKRPPSRDPATQTLTPRGGGLARAFSARGSARVAPVDACAADATMDTAEVSPASQMSTDTDEDKRGVYHL
jgi:hypothetical protein